MAPDSAPTARSGAVSGSPQMTTASTASRTSGPSLFPAATVQRANPGAALWGCCMRCMVSARSRLDDLAPVRCWSTAQRTSLRQMLERSVNAPLTSSAGRLFDAVSALIGIRLINAFEGQAAMELEWVAGDGEAPPYSFICHPAKTPDVPVIVDWEPMIDEVLAEIRTGAPASRMAARFHRTLAAIIGSTAAVVRTGTRRPERRLFSEQASDRIRDPRTAQRADSVPTGTSVFHRTTEGLRWDRSW